MEMNEYLLLMHDDARSGAEEADAWPAYLDRLADAGVLRGGSEIGGGIAARRAGDPASLSRVTGFIRIVASDLEDARGALVGNPVYEAGGTVEIRELPRSE